MYEMRSEIVRFDGINVDVIDNHGKGKPLLVFHWNSGSSELTRNLFDTPLNDKYRLLSVSLPGHGKSDWSKNPELDYNLNGIGKFIAKFIEYYEFESCWLVGQSVSAHAIIESAEYLSRVAGFVSICAPPISLSHLGEAFKESEASQLLFNENLTENELCVFTKGFSVVKNNQAKITEQVRLVDPDFRLYLGRSIVEGQVKDEWECLSCINFPVLFVQAQDDTFIASEYYDRIRTHNVVVVEGSGHAVVMDQPNVCAKVIIDFIEGLR